MAVRLGATTPFDEVASASAIFKSQRVILGSTSRWRRQVLQNSDCPCGFVSPDIDEKQFRHDDPIVLATTLAHRKADACLKKLNSIPPATVFPPGYICSSEQPEAAAVAEVTEAPQAVLPLLPSWLICSDQVTVYRGEIREKPQSRREARKFLQDYSGSSDPIEVFNAVVLVNSFSNTRSERVETARVWFSDISKEDAEQILENGVVMSCAGGFAIDDTIMSKYLKRLDGDPECCMGLPLRSLGRLFVDAIAKEGGAESPAVVKCRRQHNSVAAVLPR